MNLKDAFRYQNRIQNFMDEAFAILGEQENITRVKSTLMIHKLVPEMEDEVTVSPKDTEYYEQITDIAQFLLFLLEEKGKLFAAIRAAKNKLPVDMDSETSLNESRRRVAHIFTYMCAQRSRETLLANGGTGHRFNVEGNQVSFRCDLRKVTTINFDRNVVRGELMKLNRKADEVSAKLDACMVMSEVDYEAPFDPNDTFADAFEIFMQTRRAGA